jgi:peptidoglycan/xylan/chitin deacetylase (PgdA/CDA1 family)
MAVHVALCAEAPVTGRPITIIMYHAISDDGDPYATTPSAFRRQIAYLKARFTIIRLSDIEAAVRGAQIQRQVVITFDDAYQDFRETAYPILNDFGIPATVFVPTGFIGGFNEWDAPYDVCLRRRVMAAAEIRELQATGLVEFGSHTVDHRSMSGLLSEEMDRQARASRRALEDLLGAPVTLFAYPYGKLKDYSAATTEALARAGYRAAVTAHWGTTNSADELLRLRRIFFKSGDGETTLDAKVRGVYNWITVKEQVCYRLRRVRRRMAFERASGYGGGDT